MTDKIFHIYLHYFDKNNAQILSLKDCLSKKHIQMSIIFIVQTHINVYLFFFL